MFRTECPVPAWLGISVRRLGALTTVIVALTAAVAQSNPDKQKIVFEHGRWEIISCTLGGMDCPRSRIAESTGPVSTAYSIDKKIDELQCYKEQGLCIVASAGSASGFLYAEVERFFVAKWDERGIQADWTDANRDGNGEEEHKLDITFTASGIDSVILDDSLTKVPKDRTYKNHLIRYQLVHDSQWHHY
ncbi:MAG: hypothetical protein ACLP6G_16835 [Terriglobales bacterium]